MGRVDKTGHLISGGGWNDRPFDLWGNGFGPFDLLGEWSGRTN